MLLNAVFGMKNETRHEEFEEMEEKKKKNGDVRFN